MMSLHRLVWFVWLPVLMAGADEPRSSSTSGSVIEYPTEDILRERQQERQAAEVTLRKLRERHQIQFVDLPLTEAAKQLSKLTEIRFHIDVSSLQEEGIGADTPITRRTRQPQRMTALLDRMLQPLSLGWHVKGDSVRVTTFSKLKELTESRTYPVGRLLRLAVERDLLLPDPPPSRGPPASPRDNIGAASQLLVLGIQQATSGPWSQRSGVSNGPRVAGEQMVVFQTHQMHREISALLRTVELALSRPVGKPSLLASETDDESLAMTKRQRRLELELEVNFVGQPLDQVVTWLSNQLDDEVDLDMESLLEEGIAPDSRVTLQGRWPARLALQRMLEPLSLAVVFRHDVILVTTLAKQKERLQTVVYDVADLLRSGHSFDDVVQLIESSTSGPFQNVDGEGGTITEFPGGLLVIRQWADAQTEVAVLLHELRRASNNDKTSSQANSFKLVTRFHRAASKAEAESLEQLLMTFVAPATWDSSGGLGVLRTAGDRLVIRQTSTIHEQIDRFLREYQQATPIGQAAK